MYLDGKVNTIILHEGVIVNENWDLINVGKPQTDKIIILKETTQVWVIII